MLFIFYACSERKRYKTNGQMTIFNNLIPFSLSTILITYYNPINLHLESITLTLELHSKYVVKHYLKKLEIMYYTI